MKRKYLNLEYPYNLLRELYEEYEIEALNHNYRDNIDFILKDYQKRDKEIFYARYINRETLQQIANKYGQTRENIRQQIEKILIYMKRPYEQEIFKNGIQKIKEMKNSLILSTKNPHTPISVLGLSNRSYNALKHNKIDYVEQLYLYSFKKLCSLKGIWYISAQEIISKLSIETGLNKFDLTTILP